MIASTSVIPKFSPPKPQNIFNRSRLLEILKEHQEDKVRLILGQAAQGKSTLAASYLPDCPISWVWINLEPEDSDPVNLFYSLAQALENTLPGVNMAQFFRSAVRDSRHAGRDTSFSKLDTFFVKPG